MSCRVMGIVNVTPDSFSDGGKYFRPEEAVRRARNLIAEGATFIDFGGESTRPGATPLTWQEEWARVEPVLRQFAGSVPTSVTLSVDTYHPETAARAIEKGVRMINCVDLTAAREMLRLFGAHDIEFVVPAKILDVDGSLSENLKARVYFDPMIGFDTTREEDLELLRTLGELTSCGRVLVGASRKRIVKKLTGEKVPGKDLAGNLAIATWAALQGVSVVRVHDVRETVQSLKVLSALTAQ